MTKKSNKGPVPDWFVEKYEGIMKEMNVLDKEHIRTKYLHEGWLAYAMEELIDNLSLPPSSIISVLESLKFKVLNDTVARKEDIEEMVKGLDKEKIMDKIGEFIKAKEKAKTKPKKASDEEQKTFNNRIYG